MGNDLYESCGRYGQSKFTQLKLSKKNFKATTMILHYNYNEIFGEGSDYVLGERLFKITNFRPFFGSEGS
jgi:glutamine cyclotransferase